MSAWVIVGQTLAVLGALVVLTAALGVVRFPDAYTRISAVGTAGGAGIVLVVLGALLVDPSPADAAKVLAVIVLQLATSAVGSMAIARAARLTRTPMVTIYDQLTTTSSHTDQHEPEPTTPERGSAP